jgi:oligopeptide/dipeptide ABC transporter ATP-binding protein
MTAPLLEVSNLTVHLPIDGTLQPVLAGVDLTLVAGESLGLVGESGSGKSMTARAIDMLLPNSAMRGGSVRFDGREVTELSGEDLKRFRMQVAMIFQDPRAHINPIRRIGDFMTEAAITHGVLSPREAEGRAVELLNEVGISDGVRRLRQYPHELSGGLLQRVMIAAALLTKPRLLLADEPTTALDVTTQSEVMAILSELQAATGLSVLFITHDLELAAAVCDRTAVMYAGQIVEVRASEQLDNALHPYTAALTAARPRIDTTASRLPAIPGRPRSAFEAPADQCAFADRCSHVADVCRSARPILTPAPGGLVRCARVNELYPGIMT